jgi:hypothetical protein
MALDFPTSPTNGQVYENWIYSTAKGAWQAKPLESAVAAVSDAPPLDPTQGDFWYNTNDGTTYVWYDDGDSAQWVEMTAPITAAGYFSPNYIINGAFDIWQRGNTFSNPTSGAYLADRWATFWNGSGATRTASRQTFTPGAAPVAGYEAESFFRFAQTVAGTSGTFNVIQHRVEDVRTLAGQIVTISFWAKSDSARTISIVPFQNFGTGGSSQVLVTSQSVTLSTSWNRYSLSFSIPSLTGKTIGTNSYLGIEFSFPVNAVGTFDFWGVQVEQGQVATPFRRNANSLQGELAACQRYYEKSYNATVVPGTATNQGMVFSSSANTSGTTGHIATGFQYKITKVRNATPVIYDLSGNLNRVNREQIGASSTANQVVTVGATGENGVFLFSASGVSSTGIAFQYVIDAEL